MRILVSLLWAVISCALIPCTVLANEIQTIDDCIKKTDVFFERKTNSRVKLVGLEHGQDSFNKPYWRRMDGSRSSQAIAGQNRDVRFGNLPHDCTGFDNQKSCGFKTPAAPENQASQAFSDLTKNRLVRGYRTSGRWTRGYRSKGYCTKGYRTRGLPRVRPCSKRTKGYLAKGHWTKGHWTRAHWTKGHRTKGLPRTQPCSKRRIP